MSTPVSSAHGFVPTNIAVFYQIAQESIAKVREDIAANRRPKPNGEPGFILTLDPERKGYKASFVTIVFCGFFIESALHILIARKCGVAVAKAADHKSYEEKMKLLGCTDPAIFDLCKRFRVARREIVHEKAFIDNDKFLTAQDEAESAILLVNRIVAALDLDKKFHL